MKLDPNCLAREGLFAVSPLQSKLREFGIARLLACLWIAAGGCKMAAEGHNLQGVRLYEQGQYDTALQTFQKAISSDPENADAYYNMAATIHRVGVARQDENLQSQAESLYNRCLDLDGSHTDAYRGLAVLLAETGRSDRAFRLLKNWALREPRNSEVRIELARLYEEYGEADTAKIHLTEALQINQHNARAWNALGRLREQSGDYAQALANYQQSYQLNHFQPAVAERIASLNRSLHQTNAPSPGSDARTVTSPLGVNR